MTKFKKYLKLIVFDTLAVLCFIGVILFGWLPGPGGLPLFLSGLALLAVNHDWAERWLETAKIRGKSIKKTMFPKTPWIRHSYDIASVVVFAISIYAYLNTNNRFIAAISIGSACGGLFLFLINRERLDKLSDLIKKRKA